MGSPSSPTRESDTRVPVVEWPEGINLRGPSRGLLINLGSDEFRVILPIPITATPSLPKTNLDHRMPHWQVADQRLLHGIGPTLEEALTNYREQAFINSREVATTFAPLSQEGIKLAKFLRKHLTFYP